MKLITLFSLILLLTSCTKSDDTISSSNASNNTFERKYVSFDYSANANNNLKIDLNTVISVKVKGSNYSNGVNLIVIQNFRYKTSEGFSNPAQFRDTLNIRNNTDRNFTINNTIEYLNQNLAIDNPEVIIHDRNFTSYIE